jgi:uncharacterized protein YjcR
MSKLNESDVARIRSVAESLRIVDIAKSYGVNRSTIQRIIDRVTWKHVA